MKEIGERKKISVTTIFAVVFLMLLLIFSATRFDKVITRGKTIAYLSSEDTIESNINIAGVQLKVFQKVGNEAGYTDVTDSGFDLVYPYFASDKTYKYDLIIRNDESAEVSADQYYLRWNVKAKIDNVTYDITDYCEAETAYVYKQEDEDGTHFYSVNGTSSNVLSCQQQLVLLSKIKFNSVYDSLSKKEKSVLDNEASGSKMSIFLNIEGSLTPYEIVLPTIKFYNTDGSILEEINLEDDQTTVKVPSITPTASIDVDGDTIYFKGWIKNGQNNVLYMPNEEVIVQPKDVFTPFYGPDEESTEFTYTQDATTGEFILAGANKNATNITIPALNKGEKVTVIKDSAFYSYTKLETVNMPQTITKIGNNAFYGCTNLKEINIPDTVTSIGSSAFRNCTNLETIYIPNGVKSILDYTFYGCTKLTEIEIPNSVTYIGSCIFERCKSLTSINIPFGVTSINYTSFQNCPNLTTLTVDENNTKYCAVDNILYNKDMTSLITCVDGKIGNVVIPNTVVRIERDAFSNCVGLTSITIPDSVTSIESMAFMYCKNLTSINIPESITTIPSYAFGDCLNLTTINIPNSVKSIDHHAFSNCSKLTMIEIPDSVTTISTYLFYQCTELKSVTISKNINRLSRAMFQNCSNLRSVVIPDSVINIDGDVFSGCKNLSSIIIPNSVTSIGDYAFRGCLKLTEVNIPNSVTSIGNNVFQNCSCLTTLTVDDNNTNYCAVDNILYSKDMTTLIVCAGGKTGEVNILDGVTSIGDSAFYYCTSLTTITIPNSVTDIGNYAFYGCESLTSIIIPDSVSSIGNYAFSICTSLTTISISSNVTKIGSGCFSNCSKLTEIVFENTTGWNMTSSSSYTNGTSIDVTDSAVNATNMKSYSGSWYGKYLYRA